MSPGVLRFALVMEFILAAILVDQLWSQVGGQGHLDLIPWYWKLAAILGLPLAAVQATAAAVTRERAWNRIVWLWIAVLILVAVLMGGVTYYYHLHEEDNADEEGGEVALLLHSPCHR